MRLREGASDGEAEATAAATRSAGGVGAVEAVEDQRQVLGADAGSVVGHLDDDVGARSADGDHHLAALRGVVQRVVQQVPQDLREPDRVRVDDDGDRVGARGERDACRCEGGGEGDARRRDHAGDIDGRPVQGERVLLDQGQIPEVLRKPLQPPDLGLDRRQALLAGDNVVGEGLGVELQGRQRGTHLVGEIGQQLAACSFGVREPVAHPLEAGPQTCHLVTERVGAEPDGVPACGDRVGCGRQLLDRSGKASPERAGQDCGCQHGHREGCHECERTRVTEGLFSVPLHDGVGLAGGGQMVGEQAGCDERDGQHQGDSADEGDLHLGGQDPAGEPGQASTAGHPGPRR